MGIWYKKSRDGKINDYIMQCHEDRIPKIFKGYKQFEKLINLGYITENITTIRIMYNIGRYDEHYGVVDNFRLEGIILPAHSGHSEIHKPCDIFLKDTPFMKLIG